MKNLFESSTVEEIRDRILRLRSDSERQWGKMDPAQMLAHCSLWMEMASGIRNPPRSWLGHIFGRVAKKSILSEKPVRPNMPTERSLLVNNTRNFAEERQRVLESISRFQTGGPEKCTQHPHCFFGPMTPAEWATLAYKHLDHHLRQFGI
ncbi:MAG TPA: DUF1569 domain-containing protein [Terriglobales bacterium]|nr:DUF1569 domain-containing protein [Terriglobales bacterium]